VDVITQNLPWQIQVALASGYAGYLLAYIGMRDDHRSIDTAFVTLVFSLIASGMLWLLAFSNPVVASASAFIATCIAALVWRGAIKRLMHWLLHKFDISWSDDVPSAWATLSHNSKFPISQIAVELDDGTWLRCDRAHMFADAPFGPAVLGPSGDIALYLTHIEPKDQEAKELKTVRLEEWGDRITYVPAARVRQVTIRYWNKVNRS
jgi:hypothetical protein